MLSPKPQLIRLPAFEGLFVTQQCRQSLIQNHEKFYKQYFEEIQKFLHSDVLRRSFDVLYQSDTVRVLCALICPSRHIGYPRCHSDSEAVIRNIKERICMDVQSIVLKGANQMILYHIFHIYILTMSNLIRYNQDCRLMSALGPDEDPTSHDEKNHLPHAYMSRKKLESNCAKYQAMVEKEVEELHQCQASIENNLERVKAAIELIQAQTREKMEAHVHRMTTKISDWKQQIHPMSGISCHQMSQLIEMVDQKNSDNRLVEIKDQSLNLIKDLKYTFEVQAQKIVLYLRPFMQNEQEAILKGAFDVIPGQISEIKPGLRDDLEVSELESLPEFNPSELRLKDVEAESSIWRVDETRIRGEVNCKKKQPEEYPIGELAQMNLVGACESQHFRVKAVILKVLYYWVDDHSSQRLQVLIGDDTGLAAANLKYIKQLKVGYRIDMIDCQVIKASEHPQIVCDNYCSSLLNIKANEKGILLGEKIKYKHKQWGYMAPNPKCFLVRQIVGNLKTKPEFRVPFMVFKVTTILDSWSIGVFALIADSSGIMFAYIKKSPTLPVTENEAYIVKKAQAVYGNDKKQTMPHQVAYIDTTNLNCEVTKFPLPFWETSNHLSEINDP